MESSTLSPRPAQVIDPGENIDCKRAGKILNAMHKSISRWEEDNRRIDELLKTEIGGINARKLRERRETNLRAISNGKDFIARVEAECHGTAFASVPSSRSQGGDTPMSPTAAKWKIAELRGTDSHMKILEDRLHPDNKTAQKQMNELYATAYPEPKKKKRPRGLL